MLGVKEASLLNLSHNGINIHKYSVCKSINDLFQYKLGHREFTIRFDTNSKNTQDLPFYIIKHDTEVCELRNIAHLAEMMKCNMICSDGILDDKDMLFNFVCKVNKDMSFVFELCDKIVPLRHMYRYDTTVIYGELHRSNKQWKYIRRDKNKFYLYDIDEMIDRIASLNIIGKVIEGTVYNKQVGVYNENYVIWQIIK